MKKHFDICWADRWARCYAGQTIPAADDGGGWQWQTTTRPHLVSTTGVARAYLDAIGAGRARNPFGPLACNLSVVNQDDPGGEHPEFAFRFIRLSPAEEAEAVKVATAGLYAWADDQDPEYLDYLSGHVTAADVLAVN